MSFKAPPWSPTHRRRVPCAIVVRPGAQRRGKSARQVAALDTGIAPRLATRNNRAPIATFCRLRGFQRGTLLVNPLVLVPARMASTRLPLKPLADIHGAPMIVHVWRRACEADVGEVVVAANSPEIVAAVKSAGGRAVLTDPAHASGSDRIFEALQLVDPDGRHDVIVNVQGDLPTIDPQNCSRRPAAARRRRCRHLDLGRHHLTRRRARRPERREGRGDRP